MICVFTTQGGIAIFTNYILHITVFLYFAFTCYRWGGESIVPLESIRPPDKIPKQSSIQIQWISGIWGGKKVYCPASLPKWRMGILCQSKPKRISEATQPGTPGKYTFEGSLIRIPMHGAARRGAPKKRGVWGKVYYTFSPPPVVHIATKVNKYEISKLM